ncbi:MAG: dienelactone hydrolase family protein [Pseudorhodoplanes sp.]
MGPRRLGFDAGISCHGSRMDAYVGEFEGVTQPVCLLWGDEDAAAPPEVLDAYRALAARQRNVTLEIFPGVGHGYMMPAAKAFDATARDASMARAFAIMDGLRDAASIRAAAR